MGIIAVFVQMCHTRVYCPLVTEALLAHVAGSVPPLTTTTVMLFTLATVLFTITPLRVFCVPYLPCLLP